MLDVEPTVSTTATIQSNAGTYDLRVAGGKAVNYALTYQNGQLTITPRPLKAFVGNYERPYGQNNPTLYIQQADNGMISTKVTKGSTHTFTIYAETGWRIHTVTFNNTDVTNNLDSKNSFTTPVINENSTLNVVYEQESSALSSLQSSNIKIHTTTSGIRVTGTNSDDIIRVYTTDGAMQQSVRAEGSQVNIPLHKDKVYVVKIGAKTMKLGI